MITYSEGYAVLIFVPTESILNCLLVSACFPFKVSYTLYYNKMLFRLIESPQCIVAQAHPHCTSESSSATAESFKTCMHTFGRPNWVSYEGYNYFKIRLLILLVQWQVDVLPCFIVFQLAILS